MAQRQSVGIKGPGGKGIGGQFKAHQASEPGFSLEGLRRNYFNPGPPVYKSEADAQRSRDQGAAAASLLAAYPDVVAARFVNIGDRVLTADNGMTMANPYYEPKPGSRPRTLRRFELQNILLADGTSAGEYEPQRVTDSPAAENLAANFQDHAELLFDPQNENGYQASRLYEDHFHNQLVYFPQLVDDAAPHTPLITGSVQTEGKGGQRD